MDKKFFEITITEQGTKEYSARREFKLQVSLTNEQFEEIIADIIANAESEKDGPMPD